jgi:hypothetical protein
MKKIFTLVCMAFIAMSVNAQEHEPGIYPLKSITMGDIKWENKNNKTDINDEAGTKLYYVAGQGNAYKEIFAEYFYSENQGDYFTRPYYTYVYYWQGITGVPSFGLYYKFVPAKDGKLKIQIWANKGNRATTIVPASTGYPLVMHQDYLVEGYINGQKVKDEDGETNKLNDNGQEMMRFFNNDEIKAIHENDFQNPWADLTEPDKDGNMPDKWNYVIAGGNQAFWGWLTLDVKAGETYYVFQASSQIGFGGYDFTPVGGEKESYLAAPEGALAKEFAAVIDGNGVATNVVDGNSVVNIATANMTVEAVGSGTPTEVEADFGGESGIANMKADVNDDAPCYNLAGQKVNDTYKGVVLQNGRKYIVK